jgi:peptidoglycan/LPS O-acetylase OafA/YrhL
MLFHSYGAEGLFRNAWSAVDLFFLLSGFVIAYSSDERLQQGMPVTQFMLRRLIRLYPMILLGTLAGVAGAIANYKMSASYPYSLWQIMIYGCLTLLLLFFEFNPPFWSIFSELVVNAFYALFAKRLATPVLVLIVLLGLVIVAMGGPFAWDENRNFFLFLWLGLVRAAAGFFGGVLLYRLWKGGRLPRLRGNFIVLSIILLAVFTFPEEISGWLFPPAFMVMVAIIVFGVGARPNRLDKYCALLGQISYPLYALHWPSFHFFGALAGSLGLTAHHYGLIVMVHGFGVLIVAYLAMRFYETPVRLYLTRKYVPRQDAHFR